MPAQPKPIERHLATSVNGKTLGGRDLEVIDVSNMVAPKAPQTPEGLRDRGTVEWLKIWQAGKWLWPDQDYHLVEMIARAYDDIQTFRDVIADEGHTVQGYNGQTVAHPMYAEIRRAEAMITKNLSLLGFSPTDRARLKLTELQGARQLQDLVNNGSNKPNSRENAFEYVENEW